MRTAASRPLQPAFSLVELLCVIAIICVLAVIVNLAITSLSQGRKLTTGGNLTVDLINHARQIAKSRDTLTMVAMVNSGPDAARSFAVLAFAATNGTNGNWTQIEKWRTLPENVAVDQSASTNFFLPPPTTALPISREGQPVTCLSAVFLPNGRPLNPSSSPQVVYLFGQHASTNNFYKVIINQATGIPIVRRP
ncbi:hypothetical protein BH09VER1_BH09VER1_08210 [soil metagenome]